MTISQYGGQVWPSVKYRGISSQYCDQQLNGPSGVSGCNDGLVPNMKRIASKSLEISMEYNQTCIWWIKRINYIIYVVIDQVYYTWEKNTHKIAKHCYITPT